MARGIEKLDILFEDNWFIAVDKPSGLLSVGAPGRGEVTAYDLVNAYLEHRYNGAVRAFVLHRIDQFTSGVLLFAKKRDMQEYMREWWNEIIEKRQYIAVLQGIPKQNEGRIVSWLTENPINFTVYSSLTDNGGQMAISNYKVLSEDGKRSLVEFSIETGRKNQIRVHAASQLGCPVLGDRKYGNAASCKDVKRLCLHHRGIEFVHPATERPVHIESKTPRYFKQML